MIKIPFNALPDITRERFSAVTRGASPKPILHSQTSQRAPYVLWSIVAIGAIFTSGYVAYEHFGWPFLPTTGTTAFIHVGCFAVLFYAVLAMLRRRLQDMNSPFRRGEYLLGSMLVIAKDENLVLRPLRNVQHIQSTHVHRNGVYGHTEIVFTFSDGHRHQANVQGKDKALTITTLYQRTRQALAEAAASGNIQYIRDNDVFFEAVQEGLVSDPSYADREPATQGSHLAKPIPTLLRWASVPAIVIAIVVAVPLSFVRDYISESVGIREVATMSPGVIRNWVDSYYYGDLVRDELLPAASLRVAQEQNNVSALRDFLQEFPNSRYSDRARELVHQRFQTATAEFRSSAAQKDPSLVPFVEGLMAWLEAHDSPAIPVHFEAPDAATLAEIDASLSAEGRPVIPIAPHFTAEYSQPREGTITEAISQGLATVFPSDIISFLHAGRRPAPTEEVPWVHVRYVIRPSGAIFTDRQNGQQFVGIHVDFEVAMHCPGAAPFEYRLEVAPPSHFSVSYSDRSSGPSNGLVYTTMARLAFERLANETPQVFFEPGTPVFERAAGAAAAGEGK